MGLQILHLWKSGWFGKERPQNVRRRRERECLVKSLYHLAMAMPQSSGIARHVIKPNKNHAKTESTEKITEKDEPKVSAQVRALILKHNYLIMYSVKLVIPLHFIS